MGCVYSPVESDEFTVQNGELVWSLFSGCRPNCLCTRIDMQPIRGLKRVTQQRDSQPPLNKLTRQSWGRVGWMIPPEAVGPHQWQRAWSFKTAALRPPSVGHRLKPAHTQDGLRLARMVLIQQTKSWMDSTPDPYVKQIRLCMKCEKVWWQSSKDSHCDLRGYHIPFSNEPKWQKMY